MMVVATPNGKSNAKSQKTNTKSKQKTNTEAKRNVPNHCETRDSHFHRTVCAS